MSVKRANSIYLINLVLIFCLINLNSHESVIGQMVYTNFTKLSTPIIIFNQISDVSVLFKGQLKHKFKNPDPDNYIFRLLYEDSVIDKIYNFSNLNITINSPNTEPFYLMVDRDASYDFEIGQMFDVGYYNKASKKVSYLDMSPILPCNTLCKNN
ncbi:16475_t:CDS:1 [Gigaspora margarita]|uniref:16475_t:CDS:1 n=1 Tax=Gigaspora margarita TaxID=4874 RepID=A0ABN7UZI5_GIGMA|nr:16475_t:CDS:1 [Gigaspora margarita]